MTVRNNLNTFALNVYYETSAWRFIGFQRSRVAFRDRELLQRSEDWINQLTLKYDDILKLRLKQTVLKNLVVNNRPILTT